MGLMALLAVPIARANEMGDADVQESMDEMDLNKDGGVELSEIKTYLKDIGAADHDDAESWKRVRDHFPTADEDGSGSLNKAELKKLLEGTMYASDPDESEL